MYMFCAQINFLPPLCKARHLFIKLQERLRVVWQVPFPLEHPAQMPQMLLVLKFPSALPVFRIKLAHARSLAAIFASSMKVAAATFVFKNTNDRFSGSFLKREERNSPYTLYQKLP